MTHKYTAHITKEWVPMMTRGPLTHVVIAASWRGENPIAYTFSMDAAQAIADAFNALENMDEEFLKEEA